MEKIINSDKARLEIINWEKVSWSQNEIPERFFYSKNRNFKRIGKKIKEIKLIRKWKIGNRIRIF